MKAHLLVGIVLSFGLLSCGGGGESTVTPPEPPVNPPTNPKKIEIALSVTQQTVKGVRATDTGFESNDRVGLFVVNAQGNMSGTLSTTGNHVDNRPFTYSSRGWTPDVPVYWKDETTKADFYAYYPYTASADVTAYPFQVKADQSALTAYKASDFLWGRTMLVSPTAADVNITVKHILSSALIYVTPGDGFTTQTLAQATVSVKLQNVKTASTVNLSTGVPTLTGDVSTVTPYKDGDCYKALLPPQTVADGTALVVVTVDGRDYTLKTGCEFKTNTKHTLTVKVSKTSNGVNVGIGAWETDDEDHGGTAE